jgi:glyoxylase I family protein
MEASIERSFAVSPSPPRRELSTWLVAGPLLMAAACTGAPPGPAAPSSGARPAGASTRPASTGPTAAVVRYQVGDVERSLAFYTGHFGFEVERRGGPAFASVMRGNLRLLLSGPGSSGSRPMPDGRAQAPGGWNRIVLYVDSLEPHIAALRGSGVPLRNEIESGPGGRQILVEDPDGNAIELHQDD